MRTWVKRVPALPPQPRTGFRDIDWDAALGIVQDQPAFEDQTRPSLVIDEGQDMPPEFYQFPD